jgi:hypothetical protein
VRHILRQAFLSTNDGYSPDFVIANPESNQKFLNECRKAGLSQPSAEINSCLLNFRKAGGLQGIQCKRFLVRGQEAFRFASEVAIRFLERRDQVTLDQILCDPVRAKEFDTIAATIAPGYPPFEYRWAALNLRKRKKLRPELIGRLVTADLVVTQKVAGLDLELVPLHPGVYLFIGPSSVLYVGECQNLRKRIAKHVDHSDNKGLARWLWEHGGGELNVEYHVLPAGTPVRARKAVEAELIQSRRPIFNIAGVTDDG